MHGIFGVCSKRSKLLIFEGVMVLFLSKIDWRLSVLYHLVFNLKQDNPLLEYKNSGFKFGITILNTQVILTGVSDKSTPATTIMIV